MRQDGMRKVDLILARFPGPVTITASRLKLLVALVALLGLLVFSVHLLMEAIDAWSSEVLWASACVLVLGGLVASVAILLLPGMTGLTLDVDGFAIGVILRRDRYAWRDVSGFRIEDEYGAAQLRLVVFDLRATSAHPRRGATAALPGNYPLSEEDLALLMTQWRERALALPQPPTITVPHVGPAGPQH